MVTGRSAFHRQSTVETLAAVIHEEPNRLSDAELERIVRHCLCKRADERYASMEEVIRDLRECSELTSGPRSGANFKVLLRQGKRPRVAIPVLLILLAIGTLGGCVG
jgi:hypothetical protein